MLCKLLCWQDSGLVSAAVFPTPLGFTTVRGFGLQEARHLVGESATPACAKFAVMLGREFCCRCLQMHPVQENAPEMYIHIKMISMTATDVAHPIPLRAWTLAA